MEKRKSLWLFALTVVLLGAVGFVLAFHMDDWMKSLVRAAVIGGALLLFWGVRHLLAVKKNIGFKKSTIRCMIAICAVSCAFLVLFGVLCGAAFRYRDDDGFSLSSPIFSNKNVMLIVAHQDDEINVMGGLFERYLQGGSEVTVVFTTNGDYWDKGEERAAEALASLAAFGVKKESVYYLGFGDCWQAQTVDGTSINHIYNCVDGDAVWTSQCGATATYGMSSIDCYLDLPYTRNNYLYSIESIIQEKMPDTLFAIDFDSNLDHRATGLLIEEAMCNVLKRHPDYRPKMYKGFGYGTAWEADADFYDSLNLLSSKHPASKIWDNSAFGYSWDERVRFPIGNESLSSMLSQTAVYKAMDKHLTQKATRNATRVLNGDKVFWERRTDSLLYDADIRVGEKVTTKLNDFKLRNFENIDASPCVNTGVEYLDGNKITVKLNAAVTANCLYLYDNPDEKENILSGYVTFSDGSTVEFGELEKGGSATKISFDAKELAWLEIVTTQTEGSHTGLGEIELYYDSLWEEIVPCIMAVDGDDNLVYDYIVQGGDTAEFTLRNLPDASVLGSKEVGLTFSAGASSSYRWVGDTLSVTCAEGDRCVITVSFPGAETTFTVSNPTSASRAYLTALRHAEKIGVNIRSCFRTLWSQI